MEKETSEWCEKNDILLVAHNDQRDILPKRTMPALLQEFKDDFPYPIPDDGAQLVPRWLLKVRSASIPPGPDEGANVPPPTCSTRL